MTYYCWNHTCILELDIEQLPARPDYTLWVFCMLDSNGNEIYRSDINEKEILSKKITEIPIHIHRLGTTTPTECFIWPKLEDGRFTEKFFFQLPDSFKQKYREELEWAATIPVPVRTVTCDIFGGLANQLFQIMATLVFAKNNGYVPLFDIETTESPSMGHSQKTYWSTVFQCVVDNSMRFRRNTREQRIWSEPSFTYHPIPDEQEHLRLWGYFSSFRYLEKDYVRQLIFGNSVVSEEVDIAWEKQLSMARRRNRPIVSIHVRRGDSLKNNTLVKPGPDYYNSAMKGFSNAIFFIFSDDHEWCRSIFGESEDLHYVTGQKDYVDLLLMSKCDHHIIANSTFSWWGAYLNKSPEKRVKYPYPWFRGEKHLRSLRDFIPEDWEAADSADSAAFQTGSSTA